ncbi:MaoC family dehydratase [Streptomyces sp900116325]|uniref:MaoC family dehydratase n=1 Tax=Streptomyces sp. 900116325 TaxID=3154295 RepID=UPI0033E18FBF
MTYTLEDFAAGQRYALGSHVVTEQDVLGFAGTWDAQAFHTDPSAARQSPFQGLIASGWHTAAIFMSRYVSTLLADSTCLGSPGVDELRWHAPVRPGDTLTAHLVIESVTNSARRPDRGTVRPRCTLVNQHGAEVFSMVLITLFGRRTTGRSEPQL